MKKETWLENLLKGTDIVQFCDCYTPDEEGEENIREVIPGKDGRCPYCRKQLITFTDFDI